MGYSPWDRKELDPTERLSTAQHRTLSALGNIWHTAEIQGTTDLSEAAHVISF